MNKHTNQPLGSVGIVSATLVALCLMIPPRTGFAMGPAEVTETAANQAFADGRYREAIDMFQRLYDRDKAPHYLYNIARIHEEDGNLEEALRFYEEFVHARGVDLEQRGKASERATAIRQILASEAARAQEEQGDADEGAVGEGTTTAASGEPVETGTEETPEEDDERPRPTPLAIAGYSLLGVGTLALIGGGVAAGLAASADRSLDGGTPIADPAATQKRGRREAWAADGMFIAGGVVAAAGLTMVVVDVVRRRKGSSEQARLGWGMHASRGGAGVALSGRW